jgi:hypothetical protein
MTKITIMLTFEVDEETSRGQKVLEMIAKPQLRYLFMDAFGEFAGNRVAGEPTRERAAAYVRSRYGDGTQYQEGTDAFTKKVDEVYQRCLTARALHGAHVGAAEDAC